MIEDFLSLVDPSLHRRSGSVFYSGRHAFARTSPIYILGLNPGGDPVRQADETVARHMAEALSRETDRWAEYAEGSWRGRAPGTTGMQPRVLHLLRRLSLDPREIPASNVVFVRSGREADLERDKPALLRMCWPVHQAVIDRLGVGTILCFGGTAGRWVREALGADQQVEAFTEDNDRRWTSVAHATRTGRHVVTLTHPSIANWLNPATDPTPMIARVLGVRR